MDRRPGILRVAADPASSPGKTSLPVPSGGHGLKGLRERLAADGGTLGAGPRPDGGFRLTATVPVPVPARGSLPVIRRGRASRPPGDQFGSNLVTVMILT